MTDFAALYADYWNFLLEERPELAYSVGDARGRQGMFRESIADFERRRHALQGFKRCLPDGPAPAEQRINLELLRREVEGELATLSSEAHLRPMLFPFGPEAYVSYVISACRLRSAVDVEEYLQRLASLPQHFADCEQRLRQGIEHGYQLPRPLLPRVLSSVQAYLDGAIEDSIWLKPWRGSPAALRAGQAALGKSLHALVQDQLRPAYQRWHDFLADDFAARGLCESPALAEQPGGEAYYRHLVRQHTSSEMSPEQMHELGLAEVERIGLRLAELASEAGFDARVDEYRRYLNEDPSQLATDAQDLLARISLLCKQVDGRIPEFFAHLPRMSYGVELIPESLAAQMPGAYAQPNPPSRTSGGIFWLTSLPQRCPAHQQIPLVLHEAWPGHLMHVALLQEMEALPDFRRFNLQGYMAYAEGWALYCEKLGHDFGLYDTPARRFGQLEMELFRAIRLVLDPGLHLLGWSRAQALGYWQKHQPRPHQEVEAEIDRYIGMPGQALAYKMGEFEISRLRQQAQAALGEAFQLREFHGKLLDCGAVTLPLLAEHVRSWMDAKVRELRA